MNIEQSLQQSIAYHKAGQVQDAEQLYRAILQEEPKHPDANHNLGVLLKQRGQADNALTFFKTALESNPNQGQFWISYIDLLIYLEQPGAARNVLEQGRTKGLKADAVDQLEARLGSNAETLPNPTKTHLKVLNVGTTLARAKSSARKGQLDEARQLYTRVLDAFPQNQQAKNRLKALQDPPPKNSQLSPPKAQIDSVIALYSKGRIQEALDALEILTTKYPDAPLLYNMSGACYAGLGQLDAAVASHKRALKIKPDYAEAHNNLGNTLRNLGQLDAAVARYERALKIKPGYAEAHNNLGITLKDLGQLDAAVTRYKRALKIKPDYAEAHNNLGNTLNDLGQLEAAVARYERALKIKPDFAEAHNNLGNTFNDLGQLEAAVTRYEWALKVKPDYAEAHNNLGITLKDLGQLDAAVACYERTLKIKPDYAEAHYNLGNALKDLGQLDAAVEHYERALAIKPGYADAQHMFNSLSGEKPLSAPKEYIENLFNSYANKFEDSLVNKLEYKIPSLLKRIFLDLGLANQKIHKAIDLGCGTGLCGVEFRNLVEILIGIDLSEKMISKTKEKNIYDELYINDLNSGLQTLETKFDLFISSDVFVYIGDLLPLFKTIKDHANTNSLLIFSTEDTSGDDFYLRKTGRFSHSNKYIVRISTKLGFQLEYFERSNLRKDKDQWIIGGIYILRYI